MTSQGDAGHRDHGRHREHGGDALEQVQDVEAHIASYGLSSGAQSSGSGISSRPRTRWSMNQMSTAIPIETTAPQK